MSGETEKFDGIYSVRLARNLIFTAYKQGGIEEPVENFERSPLERDFGPVPEGWNSGLFRYLDECINIVNTAEYCLLSASLQISDKSYSSFVILLNQIKSNASAIRVLGKIGLDSQSRLALRALYENAIGLSRAIVDPEFRLNFKQAANQNESNSFWHLYMSKGKSERYLSEYNKSAGGKKICPFVLTNDFKEMHKVLGVSAHPNYLGSHFEYLDHMSNALKLDQMFSGPEAATEFVMTNVCHMVLAAIAFLSFWGDELCGESEWIIRDGRFGKFIKNRELLASLGKISGIMLLMLMKWSNRQKIDFDPVKHL